MKLIPTSKLFHTLVQTRELQNRIVWMDLLTRQTCPLPPGWWRSEAGPPGAGCPWLLPHLTYWPEVQRSVTFPCSCPPQLCLHRVKERKWHTLTCNCMYKVFITSFLTIYFQRFIAGKSLQSSILTKLVREGHMGVCILLKMDVQLYICTITH